jgi:hypothetical protein
VLSSRRFFSSRNRSSITALSDDVDVDDVLDFLDRLLLPFSFLFFAIDVEDDDDDGDEVADVVGAMFDVLDDDAVVDGFVVAVPRFVSRVRFLDTATAEAEDVSMFVVDDDAIALARRRRCFFVNDNISATCGRVLY